VLNNRFIDVPGVSPATLIAANNNGTLQSFICFGSIREKRRASFARSPTNIEFMPEFFDFFDPTPEQQNIVLINTAVLRKAERQIESCEACILKV